MGFVEQAHLSLPSDGLPLVSPREGRDRLLRDQSHRYGHPRLLRKSDKSQVIFDQPPITEENFKPAFYMFLPQAELYDIISKNLEKVTNPKGEEKPSMY